MRITGYDVNGIPRVFGEHQNSDVAETICKEEAAKYVKRRRDTGPLSSWIFMNDDKGWLNGKCMPHLFK
jgi:hypothetical protein